MVRLLARGIGVGIETADMLVHEVLSRHLRDRRAVARYDGLYGVHWTKAGAGNGKKVLPRQAARGSPGAS